MSKTVDPNDVIPKTFFISRFPYAMYSVLLEISIANEHCATFKTMSENICHRDIGQAIAIVYEIFIILFYFRI